MTLQDHRGVEESIRQGRILSQRQILTQKYKPDGEQEGTQAACDPPQHPWATHPTHRIIIKASIKAPNTIVSKPISTYCRALLPQVVTLNVAPCIARIITQLSLEEYTGHKLHVGWPRSCHMSFYLCRQDNCPRREHW